MNKNNNIFSLTAKILPIEELTENADLQNLLHTTPVQSVLKEEQSDDFNEDFTPHSISKSFHRSHGKTKTQQKVTTIGKIRKQFDAEYSREILDTLIKDELSIRESLNKTVTEKNYLYRNILNSTNPLTRNAWKALTKLGGHNYRYKLQHLITDGKKVCLSGSLGGNIQETKYTTAVPVLNVCQSSSKSNKAYIEPNSVVKINAKPLSSYPKNVRKRGIMNGMNVEFKPGPLSKKPKLSKGDKNKLGELELVKIPSVGLEVFPRVGVKLDSAARIHLINIRSSDGKMDSKWANFASSVVEEPCGKENTSLSHTFVLPYENNQNRILAQRDLDFTQEVILKKTENTDKIPVENFILESELINLNNYKALNDVENTVKEILGDLIRTVAIGEFQDRIWKFDTNYNPVEKKTCIKNSKQDSLKGAKKKENLELKRLDVTVIDVNDGVDENVSCSNEYCKLGCVCSSLRTCYLLNEHCGLPECMFKCTCNFEKPSSCDKNDVDSEISKSAVANLQHQMNRYLAKEEQKFRRTVIRSKDQTIVMGACRRGSRLPKKFEDFVFSDVDDKTMRIKKSTESSMQVKICLNKLPSQLKLEPWCMVHRLYRCFCRGRFTEGTEFKFSYFCDKKIVVKQSEPILIKVNKNLTVAIAKTSKITESIPTVSNINIKKCEIPQNINNVAEPSLNTASRTCYHEKFVIRSRKRTLKYLDRNARIIKSESDNPYLGTMLKTLMKKAYDPCVERLNKSNDDVVEDSSSSDVQVQDIIPLAENISTAKSEIEKSNNFNEETLLQSNITESVNNCDFSIQSKEITPSNITQVKNDFGGLKEIKTILNNSIEHEGINILEPVSGQSLLYKWNRFMCDFHESHIFLWATKDKPWKVYVTNTPKILSKQVCFPILSNKSISKDTLNNHPPVLMEILNGNFRAYNSVILYGKSFAWEIIGGVNREDRCTKTVENKKILSKELTTPLNVSKELTTPLTVSKELTTPLTVSKELITSLTISVNSESTSELVWPKIKSVIGNYTNTHLGNVKDKKNVSEKEDISVDSSVNNADRSNCVTNVSLPNEESSVKESKDKLSIHEISGTEELIPAKNNSLTLPQDNLNLTQYISTDPMKLPTVVKGPLLKGDCKYRWLLLTVGDDFSDMKVPEKKFEVTRGDILEAMELAEKTGKTCKYPNDPLQVYKEIPDFGIYATPGNNMKEVFLGPYKHNENMKLKVVPIKKPFTSQTTGIWTKALTNANIIVCTKNKGKEESNSANTSKENNTIQEKNTNTVIIIGKHYATLKISPSMKPKQGLRNIVSLLKPRENKDMPMPQTDREGLNDINSLTDQNVDDDVIFIPKNVDIVEISDSDSEE